MPCFPPRARRALLSLNYTGTVCALHPRQIARRKSSRTDWTFRGARVLLVKESMDAYLGFVKRGFQRAITYQFQFWSELVINLLFMFIYLCVWRALYSGRASVGGYGRGQLFSYIIVSQTLITFQFTVRALAGIEAKVRTCE